MRLRVPPRASRSSLPLPAANSDGSLLRVDALSVRFASPRGTVNAVTDVSFAIQPGEIAGIVGESGCGKSVTAASLLGLNRNDASFIGGSALFGDEDLLHLPEAKLRTIRGSGIGVVFQNPMTSLNPLLSIGRQLADAILWHHPEMGATVARDRVIEILGHVGMPAPARRLKQYPHEFSGGMRQRAMIAIALINRPRLIIADEPTTALDVTIQAQILDLIRSIRDETGTSFLIITHDLGVLAEIADRIIVMYAGRVVETGDATSVFTAPRHPYTARLQGCRPSLQRRLDRLTVIPGQPPLLHALPKGCAFRPRCAIADSSACVTAEPQLREMSAQHQAACHHAVVCVADHMAPS